MGSKKDWDKEVRLALEGSDWDILSGEVRSRDEKVTIRCRFGHTVRRSVRAVVEGGKKCIECYNDEMLEKAKIFAASKGGDCLSAKFVSKSKNLIWTCDRGHEWPARFENVVVIGNWCRECYLEDLNNKMVSDIDAIIESKSGVRISDKVRSGEKFKVSCPEGHTFETTVSMLKENIWCQECSKIDFFGNLTNLVNSKNGKLLSESCGSVTDIVKCECKRGHVWDTSYNMLFNVGTWCGECFLYESKLRTLKKFCDQIKENNGRVLFGKIRDSDYFFRYQCENGHIVEKTSKQLWGTGVFCRECVQETTGLVKHDLGYCQKIAEERGGKCLSVEYINNKTPMLWECSERHQWPARFDTILFDRWCRTCAYKSNMVGSLEEAKSYAEENGGTLVSTQYNGNTRPLDWECGNGHSFSEKFAILLGRDYFCQECKQEDWRKNKLFEAKEYADFMGGKCLSQVYVDMNTPMEWECRFGHKFTKTFSQVVHCGYWCGACKNYSQSKLMAITEKILGKRAKFNYKDCGLVNPETGRKMEVDIYFKHLGLAIEYDGQQHFKPVYFGNMGEEKAREAFELTVKRDKIKDKLVKQSNKISTFIRFRYDEPIEEDYVRQKLKKYGVSDV